MQMHIHTTYFLLKRIPIARDEQHQTESYPQRCEPSLALKQKDCKRRLFAA
eukprot:EC718292.1.p1 GENE.EC718292.1~~EC718292.1.p1  ORF type:complete len:51 (-),score=0.33 EC718292.1:150-302(-)